MYNELELKGYALSEILLVLFLSIVICKYLPDSYQMVDMEEKYGQLTNHERFLREAVEAFGEVWDVAYPNEITMNDANFQDAHHATIETLNSMVHIILNREKEEMDRYMVTRENLENHILIVHDKYREILLK